MDSTISLLRSLAASLLKAAEFDSTIEFETKSHYGGPELVYVTSKHKDSLQELTGSKSM